MTGENIQMQTCHNYKLFPKIDYLLVTKLFVRLKIKMSNTASNAQHDACDTCDMEEIDLNQTQCPKSQKMEEREEKNSVIVDCDYHNSSREQVTCCSNGCGSCLFFTLMLPIHCFMTLFCCKCCNSCCCQSCQSCQYNHTRCNHSSCSCCCCDGSSGSS